MPPIRPTRRRSNGGSMPGPGVDALGRQVIDPTENVLATIEMAIKRQDDLRERDREHAREIRELEQQIATLRAGYDEQLRQQEAARIDAIRGVDVAAVSRAAEVAATQAATLAQQVATAAEAMRVQVAAAATAAATNLASALEPIQSSINDLRKAQYEQQGQRVAQTESKDTSQWTVVLIVGAIFSVVQIVLHFLPK
jgi:cobalamin biosynthesis Mg chelatase CobN